MCERIKYNKLDTIAYELKEHCEDTRYQAAKSVKVSSRMYRFYTKLHSDGTNIGAIKYGDEVLLSAHSSVNKNMNNPYEKFFVTNTPNKVDVLYVSANRDINRTGYGYSRENDTEAKLLFELSKNYLKAHSTGTIYLYTYREPCLSCDYYIINFMKSYPKIDLKIFYEIPYLDSEL